MRTKIGLPWLLLVLMKLTNRETRSDEIVSFREAYELCRAEPATEVCELLLDRLQPPGARPPLARQHQQQQQQQRDAQEKRRQKTVFSSWGGKRQDAYPRDGKRPAFSSWGGKRAQGRPKQTFSSWGGKRGGYEYGTADDGGSYDEGLAAAQELDHRLEKRELKDAADDKKSGDYYYRGGGGGDGTARGMRALFTIFSGWPRDSGSKAAVRYSGIKSIRGGNTGFFPWGGKRDPE